MKWPRIPSDAGSRVAAVAGVGLGFLFVAVAGAVALQMAWGSGGDDVRRWTMVSVAGAGLALLAFGPRLTLARGRVLAAIVLAPVWLGVVGYNSLSAIEYFDRYLSDADARRRLDEAGYRVRRDELQRLRDRRAAIRTDREAATIEADLARRNLTRREKDDLAVEMEDARARDRIDGEIRSVAAELVGMAPKGTADTSRYLAPVFGWLTARVGVTVASTADLRALLLLAITELGAALVPLSMALAARRRRVARAGVSAGPAQATEAPLPVASAQAREDARQIMRWLDARTVRSPGVREAASDLYADYCAWCGGRGETPASRTRFGTVLSGDCGLAKRKAGAEWTVNYLGLQLKPSVRVSGFGIGLRAIAGGRPA